MSQFWQGSFPRFSRHCSAMGFLPLKTVSFQSVFTEKGGLVVQDHIFCSTKPYLLQYKTISFVVQDHSFCSTKPQLLLNKPSGFLLQTRTLTTIRLAVWLQKGINGRLEHPFSGYFPTAKNTSFKRNRDKEVLSLCNFKSLSAQKRGICAGL